MSDQIENENQQSMTPEEVRQALLAEIEATQQAIAELSNEQLEEVVGGAGAGKGFWQTLKGHILGCAGCAKSQTLGPSLPSRESSFKESLDLTQSFPTPGRRNRKSVEDIKFDPDWLK